SLHFSIQTHGSHRQLHSFPTRRSSDLKKLGVSPREILRTGEEIYKQLQLDTKELSDDELIRLMVVYPDLIQRPIIEKGDRAVMGRPPENVKALLQKGRGPESIPSGPLFTPKRSTTISSIRRRPYRLSPP